MNLYFRLLRILLFTRYQSSLTLFAKCLTVFRVWPTDLDLLRHMNNGKYLSIMDLGRVDMMIRIGVAKKMRKQGFFPVLTAETIRFQKSLKLFSRFTLQTQTLGWDEKNFYVEQIFLRGDVVYARALTSARMLNTNGKKYTSAEFIAAMGLNVQSPVFPDYLNQWIATIPETNMIAAASA